MRILVEQSSYDLFNLGDRAMLEAGLRQLTTMWPGSEIRVFATNRDILARSCPQAEPVDPYQDARRAFLHGRVARGVGVHAKSVLPEGVGRPYLGRLVRTSALAREIEAADLVVSTGGGFLNDVFQAHAAGVLAVLAAAQRLGRPTAMFGQGIGPLREPIGRWRVGRVLPDLRILGLRSADLGPLAARLRHAANVTTTGDDAFTVAGVAGGPSEGAGIGVNVRPRAYAGVGPHEMKALAKEIRRLESRLAAPTVALPIALSAAKPDSAGIELVAPGATGARDVATTQDLQEQVAQCRIVLTGSYHAAVFSLAQGVPVVGLSRTTYYDGKFAGLAAMFPAGALRTVSLDRVVDDSDMLYRAAIGAWETPRPDRVDIQKAGRDIAARSTALWHRLPELVSASSEWASSAAARTES